MCVTPLCIVNVGEALGLFMRFNGPVICMQFDNIDFVLDCKTPTNALLNQIDVIELGYVITICRKFFAAQFTNFKVDLKEDK